MPSRACPFESDRGHHNKPRKAVPFSVFFEEHTSVLSLSSGSFHKVTHRRSWRPAAVIALLVLFHVVANFVWLQQDGRTLYGHPGNHARVSLAIFDIVRRPGLSLPAQIIDATTFWPPFPYFLSQPLYALFGIGTDVTVFTTTSFLALLALAIIFTCLLGRRLYGVTAGLLAAFLFSFYPIVFMLSRTYYQDMALAALTTITFYLMLRSEAFSQRRIIVLFGLSLGLTALTKQVPRRFPTLRDQ